MDGISLELLCFLTALYMTVLGTFKRTLQYVYRLNSSVLNRVNCSESSRHRSFTMGILAMLSGAK